MKLSTRGAGRIFKRQRSLFFWAAYYVRGREIRESTGTTDEKAALRFLKQRQHEVSADRIGARPFVGPQQQRITVNELLDALQADYKLRAKSSPQFESHLRRIR